MCNVLETASILAPSESYWIFWISVLRWFTMAGRPQGAYNVKLVTMPSVLVKAPLQVCMENTARAGMSRDQYSTRRSRVLYLF